MMRADIRSKRKFLRTAPEAARIPLIAHIIYRLDVGGLENGLVNLINRLPADRFRHAIVSLTGCSHFRHRIRRPGVPVYCLNKPPGNSPLIHFKLWRLLDSSTPRIVIPAISPHSKRPLKATLAGGRCGYNRSHGQRIEDWTAELKYSMWRRLSGRCASVIALSKDPRDICTGKSGRAVAGDAALKRCGHDLFNPATAEREKCLRGSPHARASDSL